MVDVDTFLTTLYVMIDDFCQSHPPKRRPGPKASLSEGEVATLAIFARWGRFGSERDFYRYARTCLRDAFPTLPDRSQFNRLVRSQVGLIEDLISHLVTLLGVRERLYEALDSSAMPVRDAKRRGAGWLAGYADVGWSNSLGCYEGFRLLVAVDPTGVVTGFRLFPRLQRRSAGGRDLLRREGSTEPQDGERGFGGLRAVCGRQGFRRRRKPPAVARSLWSAAHLPAQTQRP